MSHGDFVKKGIKQGCGATHRNPAICVDDKWGPGPLLYRQLLTPPAVQLMYRLDVPLRVRLRRHVSNEEGSPRLPHVLVWEARHYPVHHCQRYHTCTFQHHGMSDHHNKQNTVNINEYQQRH
jgi:hypothetical protein